METIFEPLKIGYLQIKNRIVMPPMSTRLSNTDGSVSPRLIEYYRERSRGGVGMIIVEYSYIDENASKAAVCQLGVYNDNLLPGLSDLAETIKFYGAKAFLQICHGGGQSPSHLINQRPLAPSPIPSKSGEIPKELTVEEINRIKNSFGEAAIRAQKAGFDGIEIHGAHGYLINQFLSPKFNKRNDVYGPGFSDRVRFPLEVVREVKTRVGKKFPVGFRLNVTDYLDGGIQVEESKQFVKLLESSGVDYIHASAGTYESQQYMISPIYIERGHLASLAKEIKSAVNIPVIAIGGINHKTGRNIIDQGDADFVAMGRSLIADPELPLKMQERRELEIRPCIRCNDGCIGRFFDGKTMRCATNPGAGREERFIITPGPESKMVVIVGGGVAGMEAARIASRKGHKVTLFEKSGHLGGNVMVAGVPGFKSDLKNLVEWYKHELDSLKVDIRLNCEAENDELKKIGPDIGVLAVGAEHYIPEIEGIKISKVVTASEVITRQKKVAGKVLVIGAGLIGVEAALYIADSDFASVAADKVEEVTILEMEKEALKGVVSTNKLEINKRIKDKNIKIIVSANILRITEQGVQYMDEDHCIHTIIADSIVVASGFKSKWDVCNRLEGFAKEMHIVGDCNQPGKIINAINSAAEVAINF